MLSESTCSSVDKGYDGVWVGSSSNVTKAKL